MKTKSKHFNTKRNIYYFAPFLIMYIADKLSMNKSDVMGILCVFYGGIHFNRGIENKDHLPILIIGILVTILGAVFIIFNPTIPLKYFR